MTTLRRLLLLAVTGLWLGAASLVLATPASADVPEVWPPTRSTCCTPSCCSVGVPLLLFVAISFLVYVALGHPRRADPPGSAR